MTQRRQRLVLLLGVWMLVLLTGCALAPPASTPIRPETAARGISLVQALPAVLPDKAVALPNSQFVLVPNESAAGLLMPVPFVAEAIAAVVDRSQADSLAQRYAASMKNAEVIEESSDRVIVRLPGDMRQAGTAGGLYFGVHLLLKDQLHTFKKS